MIKNLYKDENSKTVYTFKELSMLSDKDPNNIARNISYAISNQNLHHIRKGLYAINKNYDKFEMATKIYKPAYISFETVLQAEGVIFQNYSSITIASYKTTDIVSDNQKLKFRKLKDSVLFNTEGLIKKNSYYVASKERAILDILYQNKSYYFDNLRGVNWENAFELVKIYKNKNLEKRLQDLYKKYS